ncbi:hypothetical protein BD311DRAFT_732452 [Dichomitus squalens]|uniref:Uncharacterized protein n=1 Tax=Dichomitus squalens TaxID=114155 RepID=A0A4Q9MAK5_9APHY|nr:hypothetical protein BD311DRAFT_732452 [Dichomitus squalens]
MVKVSVSPGSHDPQVTWHEKTVTAISHKTRQYRQYRAILRIIAGIARYCRYCALSEYISSIARPCHNWRFRQCPQSCRIFLHFC